MTGVLMKSFGTYLKGPDVPLVFIYRAQVPKSFSETYFKDPKSQMFLRNFTI
jgi:hypothetical protein